VVETRIRTFPPSVRRTTVSFVIPFFNSGRYVTQCLESVVEQTELPLEVIAVNDGSTDNSLAIVESYSVGQVPVRLVNQPHRGAGNARNAGLELARGDWIYFLDSDDWIAPDLISSVLELAEESHADVVYFDVLSRQPGRTHWKRRIASVLLEGRVWRGTQYLLPAIRLGAFRFSPCTQLIRREFLMDHGIRFPEFATGEDIEFSVNVALRANRVVYTGRRLFYRRLRAGSTTTTASSIQILRDALANYVSLGEMLGDFVGSSRATKALSVLRNRLWRLALHRFDSLPKQVRGSIKPPNILSHDIPLAVQFLTATRHGERERALSRFLHQGRKPKLILEDSPG
jgi:glycosyltransferase involved in cell wall biosynthesis